MSEPRLDQTRPAIVGWAVRWALYFFFCLCAAGLGQAGYWASLALAIALAGLLAAPDFLPLRTAARRQRQLFWLTVALGTVGLGLFAEWEATHRPGNPSLSSAAPLTLACPHRAPAGVQPKRHPRRTPAGWLWVHPPDAPAGSGGAEDDAQIPRSERSTARRAGADRFRQRGYG